MRKILFLILAGLCIPAASYAQSAAAGEASVKSELLSMMRAYDAAIQARDRAGIERVLAPEFEIVHAYGYVDSREEHIAALLAEEPGSVRRIPTFSPPERVDIYGDVVVRSYSSSTNIGTPGLSTHIFVKRNGVWQIARIHSTEMQPERKIVPVDPKVLDRYVGNYQRSGGASVIIEREGDTLFRTVTGLPKRPLRAVSETQFFDKAGSEYTFHVGQSGRATHYTQRFVDRSGRQIELQGTRVEK
jgi:hypothetical protein